MASSIFKQISMRMMRGAYRPVGVCDNAKGLALKTVFTGSMDDGKGTEGNSLLSPAECRS